MGESKNIIAALSKMKIVGYLLALLGVAFFFMPLAYLTTYIYSDSSDPLAVIAYLHHSRHSGNTPAVVFWVISAKILRAKS